MEKNLIVERVCAFSSTCQTVSLTQITFRVPVKSFISSPLRHVSLMQLMTDCTIGSERAHSSEEKLRPLKKNINIYSLGQPLSLCRALKGRENTAFFFINSQIRAFVLVQITNEEEMRII